MDQDAARRRRGRGCGGRRPSSSSLPTKKGRESDGDGGRGDRGGGSIRRPATACSRGRRRVGKRGVGLFARGWTGWLAVGMTLLLVGWCLAYDGVPYVARAAAAAAGEDAPAVAECANDDDTEEECRAAKEPESVDCQSEVLLFDGFPQVTADGSGSRAVTGQATSLKDDQAASYNRVSRFSDEFEASDVMQSKDILHVSANGDHMGWFVYVPSEQCLRAAMRLVAREIVAPLGDSIPDQVKQIDMAGPHRLVDEEGRKYPDETDSSRLHLLLPREAFVHESVSEGFVRTLSDGITTLTTMSMSPRVFVVDPMLSVADCDDLIESSSKKFRRSGEKHYAPGYENYRTSLSGQTPRGSEAAQRLWNKTRAVTGMPPGGVEYPQLLKYETHTSWYKGHQDYFHAWTDLPLEDARTFVRTRARELIRWEVPEIVSYLGTDESSAALATLDPARGMKRETSARLVNDLNLSRRENVGDGRIVHDFMTNSKGDRVENFRRVAIHLAAYLLEDNGCASADALPLATTFFRMDVPNQDRFDDYVPYFVKPVQFNRHATVLPILRPAERGGHTAFPRSTSKLGVEPDEGELIDECKGPGGLIVKPDAGQALLFYNRSPRGELDPASRHAGCSVQVGEKFACNCFTWDTDQSFAYRFQREVDELY